MGLIKKVLTLFGLHDDTAENHNNNHNHIHNSHNQHHHHNHNNNNIHSSSDGDAARTRSRTYVDPIPSGPRKGFSVPVQVAVDRPLVGPIIIPCPHADGGVQGLRWYAQQLKIDEDGDVANEFIYEVLPEAPPVMQEEQNPLPRFQVKHNLKHPKVKRQIVTNDGNFYHVVEWRGRELLA